MDNQGHPYIPLLNFLYVCSRSKIIRGGLKLHRGNKLWINRNVVPVKRIPSCPAAHATEMHHFSTGVRLVSGGCRKNVVLVVG
jgi:hypothetical protein